MQEPAYPPVLRRELRRAARLSQVLALHTQRSPTDLTLSLWLHGRADEVRAVVGDATREWSEGRLDESHAAERIGAYVRGLEESLASWVRAGRRPGAAATPRPRSDTLVDL